MSCVEMSNFAKFVKLFRENPYAAASLVKAFLRGSVNILYYKCVNPRVVIKQPFFVYEKFEVSGPGRVCIDANCSIFPSVFRGVSIITLTPQAEVRIGNYCSFGGMMIRCQREVEIGDRAMAGYSLIQDTLFTEDLNLCENNYGQNAQTDSGVKIGKNVWIGAHSCILQNTRIGDDSVISLGAVCRNMEVKDYHLASGNPCRHSLPIARIVQYRGASK